MNGGEPGSVAEAGIEVELGEGGEEVLNDVEVEGIVGVGFEALEVEGSEEVVEFEGGEGVRDCEG